MTTIRLSHRSRTYSLLKFKQTSDWSLVILWDRKSADDPQHHRFSSGDPKAIPCTPPTDEKRLTYHTTGQVNYHGWVQIPRQYYEPLHMVTQPRLVIGVSVADIIRLQPLEKVRKTDIIIGLSDEVGDERFTFGLVIAPLAFDAPPNMLFRLDYDVFSLIGLSISPPDFPNELEQHTLFFAGNGPLNARAISDQDSAMLAYHQARIGHSGLAIYPPNGDGVYHLLPSVKMTAVPKVNITFSEPGYRIEIIEERARPMLIPFKIFKGDQRITRGDLRPLISGIELDAEILS